MWQTIKIWVITHSENKLFLAAAAALIGAFLTKLLPYAWLIIGRLLTWGARKIGGRVSHRALEHRYLNWIATDLRELKLSGIVSYDQSKKPQLEQVYISLRMNANPAPALGDLPAPSEEDSPELLHFDRAVRHGVDDTSPLISIAKPLKTLERARHTALEERVRILREWDASEPSSTLKAISRRVRGGDQLKHLVESNLRVAILGAPGAGKTTVLQYLALTYARERAGDKKLRKKGILKERLGTTEWRLPIFVSLATIAPHLLGSDDKNTSPSLLDALPAALPPDLQSETTFLTYLRSKVIAGDCLFLLDGLDEVSTDREFHAVVKAVESLAVNYPLNQFVVTSRVAGWRSGIGADFHIYYVEDLTNEQVETFVDTWYSAVELNAVIGPLSEESPAERQARERAVARKAGELKAALSTNRGIRLMASNPMLLSIICLVHRSLATLPKERSKLYQECVKIFLEQWDISRGVRVDDTGLKLEQKEYLLRRIAFAAHTGEIGKRRGREFGRDSVERIVASLLPGIGVDKDAAGRLLNRLIERSGLLTERRRGVLAFSHLTFQEFFAAKHLASIEDVDPVAFLGANDHVLSDWWREVILLYVGSVPDATPLVTHIVDDHPDDLCCQRLRLAGQCLGEAIAVKTDLLRDNITDALFAVLSEVAPRRPREFLKGNVVEYLIRSTRDPGWFTRAAQFMIGPMSPSRDKSQLLYDGLSHPDDHVRSAALYALLLADRLAIEERHLRLVVEFVAHDNVLIRVAAVRALAIVISDSTAEQVARTLEMALDDHESVVRRAAILMTATLLNKTSAGNTLADQILSSRDLVSIIPLGDDINPIFAAASDDSKMLFMHLLLSQSDEDNLNQRRVLETLERHPSFWTAAIRRYLLERITTENPINFPASGFRLLAAYPPSPEEVQAAAPIIIDKLVYSRSASADQARDLGRFLAVSASQVLQRAIESLIHSHSDQRRITALHLLTGAGSSLPLASATIEHVTHIARRSRIELRKAAFACLRSLAQSESHRHLIRSVVADGLRNSAPEIRLLAAEIAFRAREVGSTDDLCAPALALVSTPQKSFLSELRAISICGELVDSGSCHQVTDLLLRAVRRKGSPGLQIRSRFPMPFRSRTSYFNTRIKYIYLLARIATTTRNRVLLSEIVDAYLQSTKESTGHAYFELLTSALALGDTHSLEKLLSASVSIPHQWVHSPDETRAAILALSKDQMLRTLPILLSSPEARHVPLSLLSDDALWKRILGRSEKTQRRSRATHSGDVQLVISTLNELLLSDRSATASAAFFAYNAYMRASQRV